jgi:hypothetical protein
MTTTPTPRTRIRVIRSDGQEWPSANFAHRALLGTATEIQVNDVYRMRELLRAGGSYIDRHGFTWKSVGGTVAEETIAWTDFTFGVEIECVMPLERFAVQQALIALGYTAWNAVYDGSIASDRNLHGVEIVSPVLQGQAGIDELRAVMDWVKDNGGRINNTCGLHVHIGVRGMKPQRLAKIAAAFLLNEKHFDSVVPPSRLRNHYCQSNVALVRPAQIATLTACNSIQEIAERVNGGYQNAHYTSYRYYKLNFQSFLRHGTIEFRQHAGTTDADKACAWVRLVAGFCAAYASGVPTRAETFRDFLGHILPMDDDEPVREYLTRRNEKFSPET